MQRSCFQSLDAVVFEHVGDAFDKLGKNAEAVLYSAKALQLNPENKTMGTKLDKSLRMLSSSLGRVRLLAHELQRIDRRDEPLLSRFA